MFFSGFSCLLIYPKTWSTACRSAAGTCCLRAHSFLFNHWLLLLLLLLLLLFLFRFEVRGFLFIFFFVECSKILLHFELKSWVPAIHNQPICADKEVKLVLRFYRMHTISNGYYMDFFLWIFIFVRFHAPLYCYSWDVFLDSVSVFFLLLVPLRRIQLFCSCGTFYRSALYPYAMNYEYNQKCVRWNLFIRFIHTTNLFPIWIWSLWMWSGALERRTRERMQPRKREILPDLYVLCIFTSLKSL